MYRMLLYYSVICSLILCYFFFNDTSTTEIYTLSLHDALPIFHKLSAYRFGTKLSMWRILLCTSSDARSPGNKDRKSTRLNSSHGYISYAVFCLKKKNKQLHKILLTHLHLNTKLKTYNLTIYTQ